MNQSNNKLLIIVLIIVSLTHCQKQPNDVNENSAPTISIIVEEESPIIGSTQTFTAEVNDPDEDDAVEVVWLVSGGQLSKTTGLTVQWTAPEDTQTVEVTANASDENNGHGQAKVNLSVGNSAPEISSFTTTSAFVTSGNTVTVTCNATDPEKHELRYLFYALPGDGSFSPVDPSSKTVVWTAPNDLSQAAKKYKLIVEVFDILGFSTADTLEILVYSEYETIWVVDSNHKTVVKYAANGEKVLKAEESFQKPVAVASNIDEFYGCYVADYATGTIFKIDAAGQTIATYNNIPNVIDIAVHSDTRTIWALGVGDNSVTVIDGFTDAVIKKIVGFKQPRSIAINQASDDVWIVEPGNNRIVKLSAINLSGSLADTISINNAAMFPADIEESFYNAPTGLYVRNRADAAVYIADKNDNQIERLTWNGVSFQRAEPPISFMPLLPVFVSVTSVTNHGWAVLVMNNNGKFVLFPENDLQNIMILTGDYTFEYPHAMVTDETRGEYWIGDNGTNQLVKIKINSNYTYSVLTVVNGFLFIEDIALNK